GPGDHAGGRRSIRCACAARVRQPACRVPRCGRRFLEHRQAQHLSHRSRQFREGERGHGGILHRAVSRARCHRREGIAEGRRGGNGCGDGALSECARKTFPSPGLPAWARSLRRGWRNSACAPRRTSCSTCRGTTRTARGWCRWARSFPASLAACAGRGSLTLRFFHFSKAQHEAFQRGTRIRAFGEARRGPQTLEMVHPEYRILRNDEPAPAAEHLTPVYSTTEGVQQGRLRALTTQALKLLAAGRIQVAELLPPQAIPDARFPTLADALRYVHRPPLDADVLQLSEGRHPAQRRLVLEELLAHHLSLQQLRLEARREAASVLAGDGRLG